MTITAKKKVLCSKVFEKIQNKNKTKKDRSTCNTRNIPFFFGLLKLSVAFISVFSLDVIGLYDRIFSFGSSQHADVNEHNIYGRLFYHSYIYVLTLVKMVQ